MKRALLLVLLLAACREDEAEMPDPVAFNEETIAHFCQMNIAEHGGPKGQIHLEGYPDPLFFAQVRDMVAYLKAPERDARITATYVSDMGAARAWNEPGAMNWIDATDAVFVVGAPVRGGMGAPEIVPFAKAEDAEAFIARYGGGAMPLDEVPPEAAFAPVDLDMQLEEPS
ncbi:nitrous oxide reductase accessory protein NosL [Pontibaca methylaminivorans]|uniref:nitrous oxide reductase accessory protein NosL n=1 Tax=Pontibaca methylaminivorans TaxID=515897 RepID=UPI002FDB3821